MMEENYKKWHNHTEQQLAAHIAAAEDKAAADAEAQRRRWGAGQRINFKWHHLLEHCHVITFDVKEWQHATAQPDEQSVSLAVAAVRCCYADSQAVHARCKYRPNLILLYWHSVLRSRLQAPRAAAGAAPQQPAAAGAQGSGS